MANRNPVPKQAKHGKELVQRARAVILNAFGALEKRGVVLSEVMADAFMADPLKYMDTAAKYLPKGPDNPAQHITNAIQLTDEQLIQIIQARQDGESRAKEKVIEPDLAQLVKKDTETGHY